MAQYRLNIAKLTWGQTALLVLFTALGLAAAVALILVSIGFLIILLPVAAVAVLVGRWRLKKMLAEAARKQQDRRAAERTIELDDYRVMDRD
jgi:hypothetical protein